MKVKFFKKLVLNMFAFALVASLASFTFDASDAYALDPDPSDGLVVAPAAVTCYSTYRTRHNHNRWRIFKCEDCKPKKVYEYKDSGTCTP